MKTVTELCQETNESQKIKKTATTGWNQEGWPESHEARMVTLWKELASLYDYQAERKYGDIGGDVFVEWGNKLRFFKNEQLRRGLDQCLADESEYAPALKAFIWYCEGKTKGLTHGTDAYRPFDKSKALTHKPDPERVKK